MKQATRTINRLHLVEYYFRRKNFKRAETNLSKLYKENVHLTCMLTNFIDCKKTLIDIGMIRELVMQLDVKKN